MARPIASRDTNSLRMYRLPLVPGTAVDDRVYWSQPKGINNLARLSQVPPEYAVSITNLMLTDGFLRSRFGKEALGSANSLVLAILSFVPPNGAGELIRLRQDGADTWNGSEWLPVVSITLSGNATDRFTWTGWGNELLFTNGAEKIISFNILTGEVKTLTESSPARHITSFNGRVVASAVTDGAFRGERIRWCVKLNNMDWTSETTTDGIGAGYEDLLASPGGRVDEVMGVFPISDESAIMVREGSIWVVLTTGDVDAPFRFTRLTGEIGCRARFAISITPFGVVFPTMEDVVVVDQSGPKSIGAAVRNGLLSSISDWPALTGAYDPRRQEYRLANGDEVWRYNWRDQGWTRDVYPNPVRHFSFVDYKSIGLTFDQLTGTLDELEGTYDELGIIAAQEGMHFVRDADGLALREQPNLSDDNLVISPIEIISGLLNDSGVLDRTEIIEAQLEYECEENQRVWFHYSLDRGSTWTQYSYVDLTVTTGPSIVRVQKTLEHHNLQVKVSATTLGKLSLIGLHLMVVKSGRVRP